MLRREEGSLVVAVLTVLLDKKKEPTLQLTGAILLGRDFRDYLCTSPGISSFHLPNSIRSP